MEVIYETKEHQQKKSSTGEIIIDEEEFELLRTMKLLKNEYRERYEQLQRLRADITYCEELVKQSRCRLLADFDHWYTESFPSKDKDTNSNIGDGTGGADLGVGVFPQYEDNREKFEKIQKQALMKYPESMAFYNARLQTERRKLYANNSGTTSTKTAPAIKQRPGSVTSSIRNAPPKSMLIH